jgi:hypothetical protein
MAAAVQIIGSEEDEPQLSSSVSDLRGETYLLFPQSNQYLRAPPAAKPGLR